MRVRIYGCMFSNKQILRFQWQYTAMIKPYTSILFVVTVLTISSLFAPNLFSDETDKKSKPFSKLADKKRFDDTIFPFLNEFCAGCHSDTKQEADVDFSGISFDLASGDDMELWKNVLKQLNLLN